MRICLNMIVKNEAPVIERCLRSAKPLVDAWAISDTGSTDGTQVIIRNFMRDLPGELIERPWVDFATNRNEALKLAKKHGDYALVIDADDVFETDANFAWRELTAPGYLLEIVFAELRYGRIALAKLDAGWKWEGVLHEVLTSPQPALAQTLDGIRIRVNTDGARSRQPQEQKFSRDADVLRHALEKEPGHTRYAFYLAQSLRDAGRLAESLTAYGHRVAMAGWPEEVYFSKFQIGRLKEMTGAPYTEVVSAYLDAFDARPLRAEAPCAAARYFRLNSRWHLARQYAEIAATLPLSDDVLFVDRTVHDWRARDEWSIASYWCGDYAASARLCKELLTNRRLPDTERTRVEKNLAFAVAKS
ncbi:MAG TPA: glycosyltransferase family 2 protein [Rudaea sp.]|jgi:glycosyltransferase involved in cell wall biosynthesis|nr:glycosyltransferase family 2 protein [Rudaea sp.]